MPVVIPATGTTGTALPSVATDEVAGDHYQVVKLDVGAAGASVPVAGTVPVSGTVGVSGTVAITASSSNAAVAVVQATPASLQATVTPAAGAVFSVVATTSGTMPVSDGGGSITIDGSSGTLTAAVVQATASALNATVTATTAGTMPVSDAGGSITIDGSSGTLTAAVVQATASALNATVTATTAGTMPVSDAGGSITIDGSSGTLTAAVVQATASALNATVVATSGAFTANVVSGTLATEASLVSINNRPATSALSTVAAATSSVTLLGSNANRRQAMLYNDSTLSIYVALSSAASTTAFSIKLAGTGYYELPRPVYTGAISGVWAGASGAARMTELTS